MTYIKIGVILSFLFILGCLNVPIVDSEWCGDLGSQGATCFHTLVPDSRDIEKTAWDIERVGMVCTKASVFADWKSVIEKLCSKSKSCTYKQKQQIKDFFLNIETIQKTAKVIN